MTDQTTTAPAGTNAFREAANEIDAVLDRLHADTVGPEHVSIPIGPGKAYRLHTRALRLATVALAEKQDRENAVHTALQAQGPTDLPTLQIKRIAQLVTDITTGDNDALGSIDAIPNDIRPEALAAVLRAGLASVVGTAAINPVDVTIETEELVGGPAGYLTSESRTVPVQAIDSALKAVADHLDTYDYGPGQRYPYACILPSTNATGHERGIEVPAPAWISARALAKILRSWPTTAPTREMIGDAVRSVSSSDSDSGYVRIDRAIESVCGALGLEVREVTPVATNPPAPQSSPWDVRLELEVDTLENPVQHAVATVLHNGWQELSRFALVRAITVAALDASADVVRRELKRPRVTPLVVLDRTELNAEQVVEVVDRYRRTMADAAADELRILARTDAAGR